MAEDLEVGLAKDKGFGFNLQIDDENGDTLVNEDNVHPNAAWSLADFCRRYLAVYDEVSAP